MSLRFQKKNKNRVEKVTRDFSFRYVISTFLESSLELKDKLIFLFERLIVELMLSLDSLKSLRHCKRFIFPWSRG